MSELFVFKESASGEAGKLAEQSKVGRSVRSLARSLNGMVVLKR